MNVYLCKLQNNAGFPVRVVVISRYGQGDYLMQPGSTWTMQWAEGDKVLMAWDAASGQLLHFRQIRIIGRALFTVFKNYQAYAAPEQAIVAAVDQGQAESGGTTFGPADTGQPSA